MVTNLGSNPVETGVCLCWAKIRTLYIKDVKDNLGTAFANTTKIVIPHFQQKTVTNKMVVKWNGKNYKFVKVYPDFCLKYIMKPE